MKPALGSLVVLRDLACLGVGRGNLGTDTMSMFGGRQQRRLRVKLQMQS